MVKSSPPASQADEVAAEGLIDTTRMAQGRRIVRETDMSETDPGRHVSQMLDAIDTVTRYTSRGGSAMACDRLQVAWMGNQLRLIGQAAAALAPGLRSAFPDVPWDRFVALTEERAGTPTGMTADEMRRFVERQLPQVRETLKHVAL